MDIDKMLINPLTGCHSPDSRCGISLLALSCVDSRTDLQAWRTGRQAGGAHINIACMTIDILKGREGLHN